MQKRAVQYGEHAAKTAPHVLDYDAELISDGRTLPRPVNYALVRIVPTIGISIDPRKRPFVVVDPRAGHGPGIGDFKADSEIGVAMKAGHVCYFIGFLPEPQPRQTIEDVATAEAVFLETVIARHPEADGKPCVIGNCQAGWAVMILAALRPELFGPIIIAGAPLSYWAGVRGQYPMRYTGGLLGGSWLTALTGDLGAGKFDGAWLVQNFENQNPANTLWTKQYNLYSKIDMEAERCLAFERWWGGHVTLNTQEMQFIVDELFVGNNLAASEIRTSNGTAVDLRTIRSPILVFCSKGDNITPPQQALDWVLDLYDDVAEISAHGQTIVYCIHEKVGHLGIFVSAGVARKEHDEFASNIDFIDLLPPGLYEAVLEPKGAAIENPDLVTGEWLMRCEARTLDDIRALGGNSLEDERRFATAARLSEINLSINRAFTQPWVRAITSPATAEAMQHLHPMRLQYEIFAPDNPWMAWVAPAAERVRHDRRPASADNSFVALQEQMSKRIVETLEIYRKTAEKYAEETFHAVYGMPTLQAAVGLSPQDKKRPRKAAKSLLHEALVKSRIAELKGHVSTGGVAEGLGRCLLYVRGASGNADERGMEAIRRIRLAEPAARKLTIGEFKALIREQSFLLLIDEEAAVAAIPKLLPEDPLQRSAAFAKLLEVLEARGQLTPQETDRLTRLTSLLGIEAPANGLGSTVPIKRKAS